MKAGDLPPDIAAKLGRLWAESAGARAHLRQLISFREAEQPGKLIAHIDGRGIVRACEPCPMLREERLKSIEPVEVEKLW